MRDFLTGVVKKVTLEVIYEVVDERTEKILEIINEIKKRQDDDFRYLNQRIDQLSQRIDTVIQLLVDIKKSS